VEQNKQPYTRCLVCGSSSIQLEQECPDHFLTKEVFSLMRCEDCSTLTTWPQPLPHKIFSYYASDNYVSHNDSKKGFINRLYHLVKVRALKNKVDLVGPLLNNLPLLDYGCGTGDFVAVCVKANIKATGVEPDPGARRVAQNKGLDIFEPKDIVNFDKRFGVITMWHVLEHTYNPIELIQNLKAQLTEGGHLIIAVPNYLSYDAQYYKSNWAAYDVPRHLFHFAPNSIHAISKITGMTLIKTLPMMFDSFYVSMLSEKYKNGNVVMGALSGAVSNLKAIKNNNYSSLIYILKK